MHFTKFEIENFKGIEKTELNLSKEGHGNIFTLVGLNESGKTTILEAINTFSPDLSAEPLYQNDVFRKIEHQDLVPKHKKDNFTGIVEITAELLFSEDDLANIADYFLDVHELVIDLERLNKILRITKYFTYKNSDYVEQGSLWSISLNVKTKRARKFKQLNAKENIWQDAVSHIRKLIPTICYFPTFLFEFPSRVYLSETPEGLEPQNAYYKQIIQDILDSLERDLTIDEHIVDRVKKIETGKSWNIFEFWKSDRKEQVDAVMSHLGNQITGTVFNRWNEIFGSEFTKNIKIEWNIDGVHENPPIYLSFNVQDGTSTYSIAERSLGFRWFFCFLLFTQFRKSRNGANTLFLLDEPASNLHATAQQQLLDSFKAVARKQNYLIYSTHSHYMINPKWLESAFIVQNGAIEYNEELKNASKFNTRDTNVQAVLYRSFIGSNNDQSTYYQPILDALDYTPAVLDHQTNTLMVEGKGDFYFFTYFKDVILADTSKIRFLPSTGAHDLGPLISLYLGWGYSFIIILDDDVAGRTARNRYIDEWYLDPSRVLTLGDLNSNFKNKKLEGLLTTEGKELIKTSLDAKRLSKKKLGRFFQSKLATEEPFEFDGMTKNNISNLLNYAQSKFS